MMSTCSRSEFHKQPTHGIGQGGFTLTELMVTVSVIAILVAVAVPSFSDFVLRNRIKEYATDLASGLRIARSEALKRNAVVKVCASNNGTSCASSGGWEQGWIVLAGSTVVLREQAIASGYRISGTANSLDFKPIAVGATVATLTVCRAEPSTGSQERVVRVNATGRASVTTTSTGSCPD
ncbi:Type II transport protein GspH [compost metagenome]